MEIRESKQTVHVGDRGTNGNKVEPTVTTIGISRAPYTIMPRVAQQPRAANGRNVSGSMTASPFKSPMKYEDVVAVV